MLQSSYIPTIACTFTPTNQPVTTVNCLLDNTNTYSTAWLRNCVESETLATSKDLECDAAPTLATLWIEPWYEFASPNSIFSSSFSWSGYDTVPAAYYLGASQTVEDRNGNMTSSTSKLYTIGQVNENKWLYNVDTNAAGSIGLGTDSPFLNLLNNITDFTTPWLIDMGQIADQSFAGGSYDSTSKPKLYIGDGDYTTLFPQESANITLYTYSNTADQYLTGVAFGAASASLGTQFIELADESNPNSILTNAQFALTYQGLGLPLLDWQIFVSLMQSISQAVSEDLTCDSSPGKHCSLSKTCDKYPDLWEY